MLRQLKTNFKRMKKEFLIFCLSLAMIGNGVMAQQDNIWTLEECISYALEQNITVRKSILSNQQLEYSAAQTKSQRFPSVNGSISQSYGWSSADGFFTDSLGITRSSGSNYSVNSSVSLFNAFKLNNQIKQSELDIEGGK